MLYSRKAINRAGNILISNENEIHSEAKKVLDYWRACHAEPLISIDRSLKIVAKRKSEKFIISQRIKRAPSIISKLKREDGMQLSRMQDIGGIRIILSNMNEVREIQSKYKNGNRKFIKIKENDYINYPKTSGYRSLHLIFQEKLNRYFIELQLRTQIQHSWATAVETMGTFINHSLKSSEGPEEYLNFFSLASSAFAILENTPRTPEHDTFSTNELFKLVIDKEKELDVIKKLTGFRITANRIYETNREGDYHLIILDLTKRLATIKSYNNANFIKANSDYSKEEERISNGENLQVVLVTSDSLKELRKAYPSYFLDTQEFSKNIERIRKRLY